MTPDTPLLFFWTASFWAMARIAAGGSGVWWLAAGLVGGLALDSKYTALFLWVGVGLWVLLVPAVRPWLRRWQPWAACAIGLACSRRCWGGTPRTAGPASPSKAAGSTTGARLGRSAFSPNWLAAKSAWRRPWSGCCAWPGWSPRSRGPGGTAIRAGRCSSRCRCRRSLVFLQHAIGDRVQGNWPAIIYPALRSPREGWRSVPLVGRRFCAWVRDHRAGLSAGGHAPDPAAARVSTPSPCASRDGTLWPTQIEASREAAGADFVAADGYALDSELAWWMPPAVKLVGTGVRWRLLALPRTPIGGTTGLWVTDAGHDVAPRDTAPWVQTERVGTVSRPGSGTAGLALYKVLPRPGADAVALARR